MEVDSPSQYVSKLEQENRSLRERLLSIERDLKESDELRAVMVDAATSTAQVATTVLARLQRAEKIVECSYAVMRACIRGDQDDGGRACNALVQAVLEHQKGQPS